MFAFLKKPYPLLDEKPHHVLVNFIIGCFVTFFLVFFQPFGINEWETGYKFFKLAGFGFVSFVVPIPISISIPRVFRRFSSEERWTVMHEITSIVFVLVMITLGNMIYGKLIGILNFSLGAFVNMLITTCTIGIFPVTFHVIMKHNRLLKKSLAQSKVLNQQLELHRTETAEQAGLKETIDSIELLAENNKDKLNLKSTELLYIESADNYSGIVYLENNALKKVLLRGSLKLFESQINHPLIIRCHRAYIVNLSLITKVEGNAAGYRLFFEENENSVPVSRNFIAAVNQKLKK